MLPGICPAGVVHTFPRRFLTKSPVWIDVVWMFVAVGRIGFHIGSMKRCNAAPGQTLRIPSQSSAFYEMWIQVGLVHTAHLSPHRFAEEWSGNWLAGTTRVVTKECRRQAMCSNIVQQLARYNILAMYTEYCIIFWGQTKHRSLKLIVLATPYTVCNVTITSTYLRRYSCGKPWDPSATGLFAMSWAWTQMIWCLG